MDSNKQLNSKDVVSLLQTLAKAVLMERNISLKSKLVSEFNDSIWNEEIKTNEKISDILILLAQKLEYYVADEKWRKEDTLYFGDDKLKENITKAIEKIENIE